MWIAQLGGSSSLEKNKLYVLLNIISRYFLLCVVLLHRVTYPAECLMLCVRNRTVIYVLYFFKRARPPQLSYPQETFDNLYVLLR